MNAKEEVVITRSFDAPIDQVWRAWTDVEALKQWWGPKGFDMFAATLDLKPDGMFHYGMRSPDGKEMWGKFVYREVTPMTKLVFVNSFSDEKGGTTPNPWMATWPLEILNNLTLEEKDGKTTVTIKGGPINASAEQMAMFEQGKAGMEQGFEGTWSKLDEYLAKA